MTTENVHVKLSGGLARTHREAKRQITERDGIEPTNPQVIRHLVRHYDGPLDVSDPEVSATTTATRATG